MVLLECDDKFGLAVTSIELAIDRLKQLISRCELPNYQLQTIQIPKVVNDDHSILDTVEAKTSIVTPKTRSILIDQLIHSFMPCKRLGTTDANNRLIGFVEIRADDILFVDLIEQIIHINQLKHQFRNLVKDHFPTEAARRKFYRNHPLVKQYWIKTIERQINVSDFEIASTTFNWSPIVMSYHPFEDTDQACDYVRKCHVEGEIRNNYIQRLVTRSSRYNEYLLIKEAKIQPIQSVRWRDKTNTLQRKNLRAHTPLLVLNQSIKRYSRLETKSIDLKSELQKLNAQLNRVDKLNCPKVVIECLGIYQRSKSGHQGVPQKARQKVLIR